ncbi:hypothetical protein ACEWY4_004788 [Coilia grayii]|uniref:Taperin n=1 Tax=Coilia grayii TaxID=363190 RepID=A0ABD1KMI3_9TELE
MSGGDVRVLHQESGQESSGMPAWKREILERRKAKGNGSGAGGESSSSAATSRLNGEVTGNSRSKNKDDASIVNPNGNYTITPASQFFGSKRGSSTPKSPDLSPVKTKDLWTAIESYDPKSADGKVKDNGTQESLVLQESLGPLQENPFIKLEKERKRRLDRETSRPVQHILELYGGVPGIRTIRAENIIIIESDPDYFPEGSDIKHASNLQHNGVSSYSSLNDLLDRRSSAVTEIHAKEVVIYDSALSRSEENLSTVGHDGSELVDLADGQGRVSRMLQKFDRNYGKLQPKSRSTENLLDLDSTSVRPRPRRSPKPDLVPKTTASLQPVSPALASDSKPPVPTISQVPESSSTTALPAEADGGSPPASPPPISPVFRSLESGRAGRRIKINPKEEAERVGLSKPIREREWDPADGSSKPAKVPCSPERHSARADPPPDSPRSPTSPTFEIRAAPRPDLSLFPDSDIQARALANLRLQSRNSFVVVPKRARQGSAASSSSSPRRTVPPSGPVASPSPSEPVSPPSQPSPPAAVPTATPVMPPPTPPVSKKLEGERAPRPAKKEAPAGQPVPSSPAHAAPAPHASLVAPTQTQTTPVMVQPSDLPPSVRDRLPITNIDDVELPIMSTPSALMQRKTTHTITVMPIRKPEPQPPSPEPQDSAAGSPVAGAGAGQAPYAQLGTLLKKRYPAVDEIEVIGGYLSLGRSCLVKTGSIGRKPLGFTIPPWLTHTAPPPPSPTSASLSASALVTAREEQRLYDPSLAHPPPDQCPCQCPPFSYMFVGQPPLTEFLTGQQGYEGDRLRPRVLVAPWRDEKGVAVARWKGRGRGKMERAGPWQDGKGGAVARWKGRGRGKMERAGLWALV